MPDFDISLARTLIMVTSLNDYCYSFKPNDVLKPYCHVQVVLCGQNLMGALLVWKKKRS